MQFKDLKLLIRKQRKFYYSLGKITSSFYKKDVFLTASGFQHLIRKSEKSYRLPQEQVFKLTRLKFIKETIEKGVEVQVRRGVKVKIRKKTRKMTRYTLQHKFNSRKVSVIVEEKEGWGDDKLRFLSVF